TLTKGQATVNADGTISYNPNGQFKTLPAGQTAIDTFAYTIADGQGASATATVTVTVTGINHVPVAADDSAATTADAAVTINVLANDSDPDSDTLAVSGVDTAGTKGQVSINGDGIIRYDPNGAFDNLPADQT